MLQANPQITIEVPGAKIRSVATTVENDERAKLLKKMAEVLPGLADHIATTSRKIPIVVITEATCEHQSRGSIVVSCADHWLTPSD